MFFSLLNQLNIFKSFPLLKMFQGRSGVVALGRLCTITATHGNKSHRNKSTEMVHSGQGKKRESVPKAIALTSVPPTPEPTPCPTKVESEISICMQVVYYRKYPRE